MKNSRKDHNHAARCLTERTGDSTRLHRRKMAQRPNYAKSTHRAQEDKWSKRRTTLFQKATKFAILCGDRAKEDCPMPAVMETIDKMSTAEKVDVMNYLWASTCLRTLTPHWTIFRMIPLRRSHDISTASAVGGDVKNRRNEKSRSTTCGRRPATGPRGRGRNGRSARRS